MEQSGTELFVYAGFGLFALIVIAFIVVTASLIYHWHYYGVSRARRVTLMTVFISVGLLLFMSAFGLLMNLIP